MFPLLGTLNRMIFWELVRVFLLSVVGLTGLVLIAGVIQAASQMGLSTMQMIEVIPLLVPSLLPYTIPATTLFASCVVYGRVSNDNEAVAMKAAGIDLLTILRPAVLLGVITTLATGSLYYSVIPRTHQMLAAQLLEDPEEILYNTLKRERRWASPKSEYILYVRDVQNRRLCDAIIKKKYKPKGTEPVSNVIEYEYILWAREAQLFVIRDEDNSRKLVVDADNWVGANVNGSGYFEVNHPPPEAIPLGEEFDEKQIKAKPMSLEWHELPQRAAELHAEAAEFDKEYRDLLATNSIHVKAFEYQLRDIRKKINSVEYEIHGRPAMAVGCLLFALIGCPVGLFVNRSDYLSTFVICFLPTMFVYYPLLLAGVALGKDGKIPMVAGVWAANVVIGLAALVLTFRLIRR